MASRLKNKNSSKTDHAYQFMNLSGKLNADTKLQAYTYGGGMRMLLYKTKQMTKLYTTVAICNF